MYIFRLRVLTIISCALACLVSPAQSRPTRLPWPWPAWWPWPGRGVVRDDERNFNTISRIYNLTVYPNQLPIILGGGAGVPRGLFSQDVAGRVDPVGDFVGFEDSIEYFFALAPLPQGNAASAAITGYQIAEFSSACSDVAASVVYLFCSVVNPGCADHGKPLAPLKQVSDGLTIVS